MKKVSKPDGDPLPGTTQREGTILKANTGAEITHYGSVFIQRANKDEWNTVEFGGVGSGASEGPIILGLPSLRELKLVSLH